ncbi:MAG TPA: HAD-IIIC family phosphatase [Pyrinomonadaceae bacterium]|jgi:FkbH-like protein
MESRLTTGGAGRGDGDRRGSIKCVVWDLDNTLWEGTLLEGDRVRPRPGVAEIVRTLDGRGILQSIASKNDHEAAMAELRRFGLAEYFIYPQINWNSKAASIRTIVESVNIGADAVAFLDDQPFELEEVKFSLPELLCLDGRDLGGLLAMPEMNPRFVTADSRMRRLMYVSDIERRREEEEFVGPKEEFLATLKMVFTLSPAGRDDLQRAEELTLRTNQLNSTGVTYSYEELDRIRQSPRHRLLVAGLEDKYGSYGKIGLALLEVDPGAWTLKLLLMSCRVMSRGVGTLILNYVMRRALEREVRLLAEFIATGKNRMMYVSYKLAGFREIERRGQLSVLENDLTRVQSFPDYIDFRVEPGTL